MKEFDRFSFPRNYSGKVPLFFRKFPEKFRRKFPEISELTTVAGAIIENFVLLYINPGCRLNSRFTLVAANDMTAMIDRQPSWARCYVG